jgi:hypothetical protein
MTATALICSLLFSLTSTKGATMKAPIWCARMC